MKIAVAGAHGQVARRLVRLLTARGDDVVGVVRNPDHVADVGDDGARAVVLDLESAGVDDVGAALTGCDAVVFAAGSGGGGGDARKDTMDRAGAALLADAAQRAGVRRYVLVSSIGVESVRGAVADAVPAGMVPYLRAKLASEDDLRARPLDWTVLRPGSLTDEPGTGLVRLVRSDERGSVPRDDVAAVLVALLDAPASAGVVVELFGGDVPVADAVAALRA